MEAAGKLSENAQSIYQYLLFQEAKREHNATVAEGALKESLKMNPSPGLYLEAAEFYWRQGLPDQTRQILKEGMERYPEEENLVLLLAGTYPHG